MPASEIEDELLNALAATSGLVCLVGAGGKKSTMYSLAARHPGRVLLSSTSHMYPYNRSKVDSIHAISAGLPEADLRIGRVVAVGGQTDTEHRVGGLEPLQIQNIFQQGRFDVCFIKADGARAKWLKSPGAHEPVIPDFATTVIPVVSARVIGQVLDEAIAHRPERLERLIGLRIGEVITSQHIADLLSHTAGSLKGVGAATVVPLINMVDDESIRVLAADAARRALAQTTRYDHIVLAAMSESRLVEIIRRDGS